MPWVTTKSGKHINTDWFDEDEKAKQRQIESNKVEATEKNESSGYKYFKGKKVPEEEFNRLVAANKLTSQKGNVRDAKDLIPKHSYTNTPEYETAHKWLSQTADERVGIGEKWLNAYKNLEDARDKYLDKEMVEALGRREARMFVNDKEHPETAQAKEEVDRIDKRRKELDEKADYYKQLMQKMDNAYSNRQREEYGRPDFKEAEGEYAGFKTKESTTPYIDDMLSKGKAVVVEMTPEQYIHECAHYIFDNSTLERTLRGRIGGDNEDIEKYARMMREGVKFDTPYLNYRDNQQEGLHRAVAAFVNGITKMPVIIVGSRRK